MDDYEKRAYDMRRPYVPRMEHNVTVSRLQGRIEELERELREYRRRDTVRRRGW